VLLRIGAKPDSVFQCAPPYWSETQVRISVCSSALERNHSPYFSELLRSRMRPNTQQLRIGACYSALESAQNSIKLCIGALYSVLELFQYGIQRASQASTMINFLLSKKGIIFLNERISREYRTILMIKDRDYSSFRRHAHRAISVGPRQAKALMPVVVHIQ